MNTYRYAYKDWLMHTQAYREYIHTCIHTYTQTGRQRDIQRQPDRQDGRQAYRLSGSHTGISSRQADNNTYRHEGIQPNIQEHIIADRGSDITTGHAVWQEDRHTYIPAYIT